MGHQIALQPDGRLAVFSSVTDSWILYDASPAEVLDYEASVVAESARRGTAVKINQVLAGERAYYQFTRTFAELDATSEKHSDPCPFDHRSDSPTPLDAPLEPCVLGGDFDMLVVSPPPGPILDGGLLDAVLALCDEALNAPRGPIATVAVTDLRAAVSAARATVAPMTTTDPAPSVPVTETTTTEVPVEQPTTEVAVEVPAKTVDTVEVDAAPETAGAAVPDAATEAMAVESKEHPA